MQYTDRETVYDLYGPASYIGFTAGAIPYGGVDLISFSPVADQNADINGLQLTAGVGYGIDVHIMQSNTKPVSGNYNKNLSKIIGRGLRSNSVVSHFIK